MKKEYEFFSKLVLFEIPRGEILNLRKDDFDEARLELRVGDNYVALNNRPFGKRFSERFSKFVRKADGLLFPKLRLLRQQYRFAMW